jgi:hypothetical protein
MAGAREPYVVVQDQRKVKNRRSNYHVSPITLLYPAVSTSLADIPQGDRASRRLVRPKKLRDFIRSVHPHPTLRDKSLERYTFF